MTQPMAQKALTLKTLTKNTVWDVQENDIFRMLESVEKDADIRDNIRRYTDIIMVAFMIEELQEPSSAMKVNLRRPDIKSDKYRLTTIPK